MASSRKAAISLSAGPIEHLLEFLHADPLCDIGFAERDVANDLHIPRIVVAVGFLALSE